MKSKKNEFLEWMIIFGVLLSIGGGLTLVFKYWLGLSILMIGFGFLLGGALGDPKRLKKAIEVRRKGSDIHLSFWESVFSLNLFQRDISDVFKKGKADFFMGFFYFLVLEAAFVFFLFSPIVNAMPEKQYLKIFLGLISILTSVIFACFGVRGYGLCMVSESGQKKSVRGMRSFIFGLFGVILLFPLIGVLSR